MARGRRAGALAVAGVLASGGVAATACEEAELLGLSLEAGSLDAREAETNDGAASFDAQDEPRPCGTGVFSVDCGNGLCLSSQSVHECLIDTTRCGTCCVGCPTGTTCVGTNRPDPAAPSFPLKTCLPGCDGGVVCPADGGSMACVDVFGDSENCGACGYRCSADQVCSAAGCRNRCDAGIVCNDEIPPGQCVDPATNQYHCGGCKKSCNGTCVDGGCVVADGG